MTQNYNYHPNFNKTSLALNILQAEKEKNENGLDRIIIGTVCLINVPTDKNISYDDFLMNTINFLHQESNLKYIPQLKKFGEKVKFIDENKENDKNMPYDKWPYFFNIVIKDPIDNNHALIKRFTCRMRTKRSGKYLSYILPAGLARSLGNDIISALRFKFGSKARNNSFAILICKTNGIFTIIEY